MGYAIGHEPSRKWARLIKMYPLIFNLANYFLKDDLGLLINIGIGSLHIVCLNNLLNIINPI